MPSTSRRSRRTQAHALDGSRRLAGVDHVADAVLVLDEHEDAREEVAHEGLGAEADRDADDPDADPDRREVHAELVEHHHERGRPHDHGDDAAQHRADRLGPQRAPHARHRRRVEQREPGAASGASRSCSAVSSRGQAPHHAPDEHAADPHHDERDEDDDQRRAAGADSRRRSRPRAGCR